jgi:hypothetical protein
VLRLAGLSAFSSSIATSRAFGYVDDQPGVDVCDGIQMNTADSGNAYPCFEPMTGCRELRKLLATSRRLEPNAIPTPRCPEIEAAFVLSARATETEWSEKSIRVIDALAGKMGRPEKCAACRPELNLTGPGAHLPHTLFAIR